MEILTGLIAQFFDKFKIANPTVAAVVIGLLIVFNLNADAIFATLGITGAIANTIKVILVILTGAIGSRTAAFLPAKESETPETLN